MKPAKPLSTYLALLRGINVGGKNMLPMKALAEMFTQTGCTDVRTYIQSGNVVFDSVPRLAEKVPTLVTKQIEQRFSMKIPVILRTAEEMSAIAHNNPLVATGTDERLLHVFFLADLPHPENLEKMDPDRSPPDSFLVRNREIYVSLPNGAARTKLTNAYFDTKLATVSTARNWRTVQALTQLMRHKSI